MTTRIRLTALFLFGVLILASVSIAQAQEDVPTATQPPPLPTNTPQPVVSIIFPVPGQAVLGNVIVSGRLSVSDYQSAELEFSYQSIITPTWFLIAENVPPTKEGVLANWNTTTISDGNYNLRLIVHRTNGEVIVAMLPGVRVRNYSAVETNTPAPLVATNTPAPGELPPPTFTSTPTVTPARLTPTPLPTNPAELTTRQMIGGLAWGAIGVAIAFVALGLYVFVRSLLRRKW